MGKALIISDDGGGLYTIEVKHETTAADAQMARLEAILSIVNQKIADEESEDAPNQSVLAVLNFRKTALQKRIETVRTARNADFQTQAWCADLTTGLSGIVGTIEPGTERKNGINIQPGYDGNAVWDGARDGQATPFLTMDVADAMRNFAILPAIQKWRPTYRYGTISNLDQAGNTCTVTLDDLNSSIQGLAINHQSVLNAVQIEYMNCDAAAFEDGDRVIVKFEPYNTAGQPKAIGFVDHPKNCGNILLIEYRNQYIFWNPYTDSLYDIQGFSQPMDSSDRSAAMNQIGFTVLNPTSSIEMASGGPGSFTYYNGTMVLVDLSGDYCSTDEWQAADTDGYLEYNEWSCHDSVNQSRSHTIFDDTSDEFEASVAYERTEYQLGASHHNTTTGVITPGAYSHKISSMTMNLTRSLGAIRGVSLNSEDNGNKRAAFFWATGPYATNYSYESEYNTLIANYQSTQYTRNYSYKSPLGNDALNVAVDIVDENSISPTLDDLYMGGNYYAIPEPMNGVVKESMALVLEQPVLQNISELSFWGFSRMYVGFDGELVDSENPALGYTHSWGDLVELDTEAIYQAFGTSFDDELVAYGVGATLEAFILSKN